MNNSQVLIGGNLLPATHKTQLHIEYNQYGRHGHSEDTWSESCAIGCEEDVYKFLKDIYRRDAHNHSDFPLCGHIAGTFRFYIYQHVVIGEETFHGPKKETAIPEYFDAANARFDKLFELVQSRLPSLRKCKYKREQEEKERQLLEDLNKKYNGKFNHNEQ